MIKHILLFALFFVLSVFIYRNGLHIPYYADDYQRVFTNPPEAASQALTHANYSDGSYRPVETISLGIIQSIWGWDTFPLRILSLLFHAAGAFLVYHALRFWKVNEGCAILAACFVIVSQMSAAAVLGNDTQSQVTGALFSALSLWLLYRYRLKPNDRWRYVLSVLFFFLALVSKETSSGLCLSVAFTIFIMQSGRVSKRIRQTIITLLPYVLGFAYYWILRAGASANSPAFGDTNLSLKLGLNIPINIGLFFLQSILPVSSMAVMKALHYHDHLHLVFLLGFTALFVLMIGYGLWKSSRRKIIQVLCVIIFFGWFPAMILNHISELYAYSSVFAVAALFGIAIEFYWNSTLRSSKLAFPCIIGILIGVGITNELGADEKASSMKVLGDRAAAFLPQLVSLARTLPHDNWFYLIGPKDTAFQYSMFAISGFRVSATSDSLVRFFSQRPDIGVYVIDTSGYRKEVGQHPGVRLTYDPATLHIYSLEADSAGKKEN